MLGALLSIHMYILVKMGYFGVYTPVAPRLLRYSKTLLEPRTTPVSRTKMLGIIINLPPKCGSKRI